MSPSCGTCKNFTRMTNPWSDQPMPVGHCMYFALKHNRPPWAAAHQVDERDGQGCTVWEVGEGAYAQSPAAVGA